MAELYTPLTSGSYAGLRRSTRAADMRGAVDFTNANAFNLYEKGHSLLKVLSVPKFMTAWANKEAATTGSDSKDMVNNFYQILEQEFKGLSGLDDMSADTMSITDGISELNVLGKVNYATSQEISMTYTEKAGSTINRYCETYLRGIRDPRTLVKHYNGVLDLSADASTLTFSPADCKIGDAGTSCPPGFENEVFTLLYIVTDNTWLRIERAYLLCNCMINKATLGGLHNVEKGTIELAETEITMNTFVVTNANVNQAAAKYLETIRSKYSLISNNFHYNAQDQIPTGSITDLSKVANHL